MTIRLDRRVIRLQCDAGKRTSEYMADVWTGAMPELWRGNDVQFEIGLFRNGVIVDDLSNIESMTLRVNPDTDRDGAPVMTKTISGAELTNCDASAWAAGTGQHAVFTFLDSETNLEVGDDNEERYWLVVSLTTTDVPDHDVTVQATKLLVVEDGTGVAGNPPQLGMLYFTKDQCDARYMQQHKNLAGFRFTGLWPEWYFPDGFWRALVPKIVDGEPTIAWGDPTT